MHPDEAIEKLKKLISANQEWAKSAKLFCALGEKIEKIEKVIESLIGDKFENYLLSPLNWNQQKFCSV